MSSLHAHLSPLEDRYPEVAGRLLMDTGQSERGWHLAACGLQCLQKRAYKELLKNDPRCSFPETDPLVRGVLMHVGLAHYYRRLQAVQQGKELDVFHDPISAMALLAERMDARPNRHPDSVPYSKYVEQCQAALKAYTAHWGGLERYTILGVEIQYRTMIQAGGWSFDPDVTAWLFTQRADLIVRDERGKTLILDHKTRGKRDPRAHRAYARDGQFQGYRVFGKTAYGSDFGGTLINYVTFGAKATTFEREPPEVLPWRVACFADTIRWAERTWQDCRRLGLDPWKYPKAMVGNGACEHRYGPCEGAHLCDYGPDAQPKKGLDKWGLDEGE